MSINFRAVGAVDQDSGLEGTIVIGTGINSVSIGVDPTVTLAAAHGLSNGDAVTPLGLVGDMTILNGVSFVIANASGSVLDLVGADTSGLTYTADGGDTINRGQNVPVPTAQSGDLLLLYACRNDATDGFQALEDADAAWTLEPVLSRGQSSGSARSEGVYYKIATGNEPATIDVRHSDVTAEQVVAVCVAYRGVDTGNPIDVVPTVSHVNESIDGVRPTNPAITTLTDNAMVVLLNHTIVITQEIGVPGFLGVNEFTLRAGLGHTARGFGLADKIVHSLGTETPTEWKTILGTAGTTNSDSTGATLALRPAAVQTESFDNDAFDSGVFDTDDFALISAGGDVTRPLTGEAATSAAGTAKGNISVALSGVVATAAVGAVVAAKALALAGVFASGLVGAVGFTESGNVGITGNVATSAVGDVTNDTTVALTGVSSNGFVGTLAARIDAEAELTGVEATSAVGTVGFTKSGSVALTGESATSAAGSVGFTESGNVGLTGVVATGAVGTVGVIISAEQALTGVGATSAVDSVANETSVALTGEAATVNVGSVTPDTTVALTGEQAAAAVGSVGFTESGNVGLTGVVATSAVGTVVENHSGSSALTGVVSTSAEGDVLAENALPLTGTPATSAVDSVTPDTTVALTGVTSTSAVGAVGFTESGNVGLTGVVATSAVDTVTPVSGSTVAITGVVATSAVGSIGFTESGNVGITGVVAASAVDTIAPETVVAITGEEATSAVGTIIGSSEATAALTGVEATSAVGTVTAVADGSPLIAQSRSVARLTFSRIFGRVN